MLSLYCYLYRNSKNNPQEDPVTQNTGNYNPAFAATGTCVPTYFPFSRVPDEIMCEIILFNPDSARVLRAVSRIFRENTGDFLQKNAEEILSWCSSTRSSLANLIGREFASITLPPGAQPDRIFFQFHISLPRAIRRLLCAFPAECPGRILLAQEIPAFNSRVENKNLATAWGPILRAQETETNI
jgi:hypothetical protein